MQKHIQVAVKIPTSDIQDSGRVRMGAVSPAMPPVRISTETKDAGKVRMGAVSPAMPPVRIGTDTIRLVGRNTQGVRVMNLNDGDRILSTAAPAGPAFEGGAIRCGMRADDGAIEVVRLVADGEEAGVTLGVIGDVTPKGLCGSGLVDAVAELVKVGLLDSSGRFVPDHTAAEIAPALAHRLTRIGEERVFVLHRPYPEAEPAESVYLSQRDVRIY